MNRRKLGANGPEVSAVGSGAMSFFDMYGPIKEAESHAIMDVCRELGITRLETANVHGVGKPMFARHRPRCWSSDSCKDPATPGMSMPRHPVVKRYSRLEICLISA